MWIITNDHLAGGAAELPSRVTCRSKDYDEKIFARADTIAVRLLDDDGEVIYEALATRERILDSVEDRAFELLDWGMADAGCTELQYLDATGHWHKRPGELIDALEEEAKKL